MNKYLNPTATATECRPLNADERQSAEEQAAIDERTIAAAVRVIRAYNGTRLYGALRRAGLEEVLQRRYLINIALERAAGRGTL